MHADDTIRVTYEGATYRVRPEETLLDAFLRAGAQLNFSCRKGSCHVCMLCAEQGDPGAEARANLREDQRRAGLFLACQARPREHLVVSKPDPSSLVIPLHVQERERLSARVVCLRALPETEVPWRPGQYISVEHPSGALRSYSLASIQDDFMLEFHVREVPGGLVSPWLANEVAVGDVLKMRGPMGSNVYDPSQRERDLLLVAGGTGLAPLLGIARDALQRGHLGQIHLLHGSSSIDGIYQHARLEALAATHENFHYEAWVDASDTPLPAGIELGRVVDAAFREDEDRAGVVLYLAGPPDMVYEARARAVLAGVARADTLADPFEDSQPWMPDDKGKLAQVAPDPELWQALDEGPGLTAILADFYGLVFEDPQLAPFFHNVTKARAIEKQYEFLSDVFTGKRHFLGARPFNAHHWMVISDELFDHREALFEAVLRRHGLAEHLVRRWSAFHELFRREIVKAQRRGLVIDGIERREEGYVEELMLLESVCDGCANAIEAGMPARHHVLTGKLYCKACGTTSPNPAAG